MHFICGLNCALRVTAFMAFSLVAASTCAQQPVSAGADFYVNTAAPTVVPRWQTIELGPNGRHYCFPFYANRDLNHDDLKQIKRVIIVLHGIQRDAAQYYATVAGLLDTPARIAKTLIIAPKFPSNIESAFSTMPAWHKTTWAEGGDSVRAAGRPAPISSFQVLDDLLHLLSNRHRLPALAVVVLAGHSAGGQMAHRYAMLNSIDAKLKRQGVQLHYVVANPSSYLYPTADRPRLEGLGYAPYERGICPTYNQYKYGMDRLPPYAKEQDQSRLFVRYVGRTVTYLLGEADNNPEQRFLDETCGAEAQGATRLARGLSYVRYEAVLAARNKTPVALTHHAYEVIGVGHDGAAMLRSICAIRALWGDEASAPADAAPCRLFTPKPE